MKRVLREVRSLREAQQLLRGLGVDSAGVGIMAKKMIMRVFELRDLSVRGANILKQECIAVGGDLALPKEASMLRGEKTDAIMMLNESQLEMLLLNLRAQPFGLKKLGEELRDIMRASGKVQEKAKIMGVLNVTPDSFSDGGLFFSGGKINTGSVLHRVEQMIDEGADIIDIGGESTGPGSKDVSSKEELARVEPVLELLARKKIFTRVAVSVDTYKSPVARRAIDLGVPLINDVTALRGDKRMASVLADSAVQVVMMYAKDIGGRTTRAAKQYRDVMHTIGDFFEERLGYAEKSGISRERIILDPGMGAFVSGDPKYSFEILRRVGELKALGLPILIGASRKSFIPGKLNERLEGSLAAAMMAYNHGADILRVHDVAATKRAIDVVAAIKNSGM